MCGLFALAKGGGPLAFRLATGLRVAARAHHPAAILAHQALADEAVQQIAVVGYEDADATEIGKRSLHNVARHGI